MNLRTQSGAPPHLCMIFEATGRFNAIGRIAMAQVEAALDAGWRVSVVAHRLDEALLGRVEWLKLYNPPRGFAVKWLSARHFIKKAMGDPTRFDVIHGHQPQIADLCDVFECHYLTRAAIERGCRDARPGLRGALARLQESIVLRAEDRCYQRWNPRTQLVCGSALTQDEFERLYALPPRHDVHILPAPPWNPCDEAERRDARQKLVGDWDGPVVGYLGGMNDRKGYRQVIEAAAACPEAYLLFGGPHGDAATMPAELNGRCTQMGLVGDVNRFYAAMDVLMVPSVFEPFGLVCFEAASRGVPAIATEGVGALATLEPYGAAEVWSPGEPLQPTVRALTADPYKTRNACRSVVQAYAIEKFNKTLLEMYQSILDSKQADHAPEANALHA